MKKIISVIIFCFLSFSAAAKISFGSVDLNSSDEVLFTVKQDMTGMKEYSSLFYAKLKDGLPEKSPELLTCYPERMELLDGGKILQVRNRYGRGHFNTVSERFAWVESEAEIPENSLPVDPYAVSPDGKWICKNGKSRTTVECKQNGSMTITQKTKGKTAKWSGTFTATSHTITFKITSVGGRAGESTGTWILTYNLQEGGKAIKIQSLNLPNDGDGTNFKLGALFTK